MPTHGSASEESEAELEQDDVDNARTSKYLACLYRHIHATQQHLLGHDTARVSQPSFFAPNSFWSSEEKDKFFHGLSIYSRLRPDLIADDIGTKNLTEVCVYLDMLDEAKHNPAVLAAISSEQRFTPSPRQDFPIACEVSEDWIAYEADMATSAIALEPLLHAQAVERSKADEVHSKRLEIRASKGDGKTADNRRDREGEKARRAQLKEWESQRQKEWNTEAVLRHLDTLALQTIDAILREDEESWSIPRESTERSREWSVSVLHETPGDPDELLEDHRQDNAHNHDMNAPVVSSPSGQSSTLIASSSSPANTQQLSEGQLLQESAVAQLPEDDLLLSPASRRRLRKRLYMRQKRAEKTGQTVDKSITRLKPGRKAKPRKVDVLDEAALQAQSDAEASETEKAFRHAHVSGKTKAYKVREHFDALGIDAMWLRSEGLGLFHMTAMSRMIRTYAQLHGISDEENSQIAADTIRGLHNHVVDFISKLVRQSVISRDLEMVAKTHTKAWRLAKSQIITASNVAHALSILSDRKLDKWEHFARLPQRLGLDEGSELSEDDDAERPEGHENVQRRNVQFAELEEDDEDVQNESEGEENTDIFSTTRSLSLKRVIRPPYVRLPYASRRSDLSHSPHSHVPWTASLSADIELNEDDLLPSDLDEARTQQDLDADDEFDEKDHEQEMANEARLWRIFEPSSENASLIDQVGPKRPRGIDDNVDEDGMLLGRKQKKRRLNKETCEPHGRIKSAPYIYDSD